MLGLQKRVRAGDRELGSLRNICPKVLALDEDRDNTEIQKRKTGHTPWKLLTSRAVGQKKKR